MPYLTALIIGAQMITLIPAHTTDPTTTQADAANIETWYDGTLVYAHNNLAGAQFYTAETITALYSDGSARQYQTQARTVTTSEAWETNLLNYSTPETITLATCYPENATASWRLLVQLAEVNNDDLIRYKFESR